MSEEKTEDQQAVAEEFLMARELPAFSTVIEQKEGVVAEILLDLIKATRENKISWCQDPRGSPWCYTAILSSAHFELGKVVANKMSKILLFTQEPAAGPGISDSYACVGAHSKGPFGQLLREIEASIVGVVEGQLKCWQNIQGRLRGYWHGR